MVIPDPTTRACLTADEAFAELGIDRTTGYRAIKEGTFPVPVIRVGRLIRVPTAALRQLLDPAARAIREPTTPILTTPPPTRQARARRCRWCLGPSWPTNATRPPRGRNATGATHEPTRIHPPTRRQLDGPLAHRHRRRPQAPLQRRVPHQEGRPGLPHRRRWPRSAAACSPNRRKVTFGDFLTERWLPARKMSLRPSTYASYQTDDQPARDPRARSHPDPAALTRPARPLLRRPRRRAASHPRPCATSTSCCTRRSATRSARTSCPAMSPTPPTHPSSTARAATR